MFCIEIFTPLKSDKMKPPQKINLLAILGLSLVLCSNDSCNSSDDSLGIQSLENVCLDQYDLDVYAASPSNWLNEYFVNPEYQNKTFTLKPYFNHDYYESPHLSDHLAYDYLESSAAFVRVKYSIKSIWKLRHRSNVSPKYVLVYKDPQKVDEDGYTQHINIPSTKFTLLSCEGYELSDDFPNYVNDFVSEYVQAEANSDLISLFDQVEDYMIID